MKKALSIFLALVIPANASVINYIVEHEEAHYEKANVYCLNAHFRPRYSKVDFNDNGTDRQNLDVIGAGITREQAVKYALSRRRIPNSPYTFWSLFEFNNKSDDGKEYLEINPRAENKIQRAATLEPFVLLGQLICNYYDSPWYIHSRTEIDRRGVVSFYEVSYTLNF